jgi:CrcB protein
MIVVAAMIGSGVGALARWELGGAVQRRTTSPRPWGTAAVNLVGAALLGVLVGLGTSDRLSADAVTVLGTGFCGGFTTFSTWMVESVRLGEEGGTAGLIAVTVNVGAMFAVGVAIAAITVSVT